MRRSASAPGRSARWLEAADDLEIAPAAVAGGGGEVEQAKQVRFVGELEASKATTTPMTTCGLSSSAIVRPTTPGSAANSRRQPASLSTTTGVDAFVVGRERPPECRDTAKDGEEVCE